MAHQFVFTSLEKTLGGGPGFGIVGVSPGFPEALRTRSMGLVSYEGLQSQNFATRVMAPVNWLGMKLDAGTKTFFVLGRIGSAPNDYSGRRNHIAHLLFLDHAEAASVHPASLLREFAWMDSWHGPARPLPNPVITGNPMVEPASRQWSRLTGDSGYAGAAWDAMENGKPLAFVHEGLSEAILKDLVIEALSQAPAADAWQLRFATLSGDFTEGKQSDLAGAALGSRQAELWSSQRIPHIVLGSVPRILPKLSGVWAEGARNGRAVATNLSSRKTNSSINNSARVRPTATIVPSEFVETESVSSTPIKNLPIGTQLGTQNPPPDPMRLLIPGAIGFFLGMLFTGTLVSLGFFTYWHLRDQAQIAQEAAAQNFAAQAELQKVDKQNGEAGDKVAQNQPEAPKPNDPQTNKPLEDMQPPKVPEMIYPTFLKTPVAFAKIAVGLFGHEPLPPPEIEAQARMIRKLKNMQGFNAIEKELIRADRVWELSRMLQTVQPPLPDPFTHDRLDKLTTPQDEYAWVMEVAGLIPFGNKSSALAYLSLIANRDRIQVCVKKIEDRTKGDQALVPLLQKIKDALDLYKNH